MIAPNNLQDTWWIDSISGMFHGAHVLRSHVQLRRGMAGLRFCHALLAWRRRALCRVGGCACLRLNRKRGCTTGNN